MRNEGPSRSRTSGRAPQPRPLAVLAALGVAAFVTASVLSAGLAAAAPDEARFTARDPVKLVGEVTAEGEGLSVVLTHPGESGVPGLAIEADFVQARIVHHEETRLCSRTTALCQTTGSPDRSERFLANGLVRIRGDKASPVVATLATLDRWTPGWPSVSGGAAAVLPDETRLALVSSSDARLSALHADLEIKPKDPANPAFEPSHTKAFAEFDAGTFRLGGLDGARAAGAGTFRLALFGARLDATGLAPDGTASTTASWSTGFRNESVTPDGEIERRRFSYVVVEGLASTITLDTTLAAEVFASPLSATYGAATLALEDVLGDLPSDDGPRNATGDAVLAGPVTFLAEKHDAEQGRLGLRILRLGDAGTLEAADTVPHGGEPGSPMVGLAASAAAAGGLFALAFYWPFVRHALGSPIVAALYTRIGRDEVLEHGKREEIYELIRANPGIHAHDVSAKAGIGWGTTVYHLKLLEDNRLVVSRRLGRYKRFYLNAGHITQNKDAYAVLRNETGAALARAVRASPGVIQKDLCAALGVQPSLVSWHMDKLEGAGLVKKVKEGRIVRYYAGPAWEGLELPVEGNN
ncbi:MAG TPA: ArsR family transcriptional regulator [Candidatus Thermoplasmatota archaeon]|nr:ArsR family transcriptional regulator [Candidatus Thermoplasmatota archaeon]